MQWLFDIILDMVESAGFLKSAFVDRGDPASVDFDTDDFTKDSGWHDLDLSAIVPAGAKAVVFHVILVGEDATTIYFRTKGNVNNFNMSTISAVFGFSAFRADMICPLNTDRFLSYNAGSVVCTILDFTVKGWIL